MSSPTRKSMVAMTIGVAVVILGGRIVAVWFLVQRAKTFTVDVRPFARLDKRVRDGIHAEAEALAQFVGARCDVVFSENLEP